MMIRHICMFTIQNENKENNIQEFIKQADKLKDIKEIKKFNVVRNTKDMPESNYDVALIFDFENIDALNSYQNSQLHLEFGKFVSYVRVQRACIDYEF